MSIQAARFTFHCTFTSDARLPAYLGSALRGGFGWALKKTSCALRKQNCASCLLRDQCAYAWIFETELYKDHNGRTVNARPHPFVLQPGEGTSGPRQAEDRFTFALLLMGRAIDFLPHIVYSVEIMGESGIGAGKNKGMGRFRQDRITCGHEIVYSGEERVLRKPAAREQLCIDASQDDAVHGIGVTLHTPLRVKLGNELQNDLPFHVLIRTVLRRIAALEEAYGGGEPELDYRGLISRAERIEAERSAIRWQELLRFSNRQKTKVSLSGLIGTIRYRGELGPFMPLLTYGAQVNVGKQTVFGLGSISVDTGEQAEDRDVSATARCPGLPLQQEKRDFNT